MKQITHSTIAYLILQITFIVLYINNLYSLHSKYQLLKNMNILTCTCLILVILLLQTILQVFVIGTHKRENICAKRIFHESLFLVNCLSAGLIFGACMNLKELAGINQEINKFILNSGLALLLAINHLVKFSVIEIKQWIELDDLDI